MSKINLTRKSRIILPDEQKVTVEHFDDLLGEDLTEFEEDTKEEEEVEKRKILIQDDTPTEDFFQVKAEKQPSFGEIDGMDAVTEEENEGDEGDEARKEDEIEELPESADEPPRSVSVDASALAEDKGFQVNIEPVAEEPAPEVEAEDTGIQVDEAVLPQVISLKEIEEEDIEALRVSKVTILEDRESVAKMQLTEPDQKSSTADLDEESKPQFHSEVSSLRSAQQSLASALPRPSIFYDLSGRINTSAEEDFQDFFAPDKQEEFRLPDDVGEGAEEESIYTVVEDEEVALDRTPYYEKYEVLVSELGENRIRNNILQKLVIMYLKRRKVEHILKDAEPPLDQLIKYGQKLDAYEQLIKINDTERDLMSTETDTLRKKRDQKSIELKKLFKDMQTREGNVGYGLIYAKTGNQVPDKLVERFIRRQANQIDQVSVMRLKYIKLKGMVQEKLDAIERIDTIENNLHLADYEQLKSENRSYADKIEERDEELTRLRSKCQNTIQILAHMREKSAALNSDLFDLREEFESVDDIAKDLRENLAELKHSRDKYRQLAKKIKDESGLLTKTDMLRDMEKSQLEVIRIEKELARCKEEAESKTEEVRRLRKNIERITEILRRRAAKAKNKKYNKQSLERKSKFYYRKSQMQEDRIYKGRPTLYVPYIKDTAFDGIVKIKPSLFINTRKRH